MVVNDTSTGEAAGATAKPNAAVKSVKVQPLLQNGLPRGNTARTSDARAVWLGMLQDLILNGRAAGLEIEVYDMRPNEDAFGVVIGDSCYHATCGNFSLGAVCGKCGESVVSA
jgi:hypothetical protein